MLRDMMTNRLSIPPTSKKRSCTSRNDLSCFSNIVPYFVVSMLPYTPEGHTENLFLLLIRVL